MQKPIEFWLGVIAASIYVFDKHKDKPWFSRLLMVVASAGFGVSLASDVSLRFGVSEPLSAILLIAVGYLLLDFVTALIGDREFLKELIRDRFKK